MSLLSQASLIVTPNAYKEGKLYSVIPSDGSGDFTFTRATSATRVNAEGLIETASVLGSELVVNGDFATNSIWTTPTGWSISNGTLQGTNANAISATQSGFSFLNKSFKVEYTITEISQGGIKVFLGGSQSTPQRSAVGTYVEYIDITSGNSTLYIYGINFTGKIDNVSVKEVITNNIPRLDYSLGGCPNILLEPQRTNLLLQSSSFDSASWNKTRSTVTANATTSPSGVMDADTFTADGSSGVHQVTQSVSVTSGTTYTYSIYVKKDTNNFVQLGASSTIFGLNFLANFDLNNGVVGSVGSSTTASIQDVGNGWYRCIITGAATATTSGSISALIVTSASSARAESNTLSTSVFFWGAQVEAGSYATSYIPTTTASVTRNLETVVKTGATALIGQTEGTMFLDFVKNNNDLGVIQISDGTTSNRIYIGINNTNIIAQVRSGGGAAQAAFTVAATNNTRYKCAIAYKANDFVLYINGNQEGIDTSGLVPVSFSQFQTSDIVGSIFVNPINSTALWKERLTNDQLEALTGEGFNTYAEMANYYNYITQ